MKMDNINIMLVGVGGQGTIMASNIIGEAAMMENYDVKVSEVHGMSQRGGNVVTYVKIGMKVNSPLIEKNEADIILAFEQFEALRWIGYLKENGKIIMNTQKIDPLSVIMGKMKYPDNIVKLIKSIYGNTVTIDALSIAKRCGNIKAVNMVMLGVMAKSVSIKKEIWIDAIKKISPANFAKKNIEAFEAGYTL